MLFPGLSSSQRVEQCILERRAAMRKRTPQRLVTCSTFIYGHVDVDCQARDAVFVPRGTACCRSSEIQTLSFKKKKQKAQGMFRGQPLQTDWTIMMAGQVTGREALFGVEVIIFPSKTVKHGAEA